MIASERSECLSEDGIAKPIMLLTFFQCLHWIDTSCHVWQNRHSLRIMLFVLMGLSLLSFYYLPAHCGGNHRHSIQSLRFIIIHRHVRKLNEVKCSWRGKGNKPLSLLICLLSWLRIYSLSWRQNTYSSKSGSLIWGGLSLSFFYFL